MRFASLGSGSQGNATLVEAGDTLLLVDCGFSKRETEARLARLGVSPKAIDGILVTHEHGDHCSGVAAVSRGFQIPVFLSHGTASHPKLDGCYQQIRFNAEDCFGVGDISVCAVPVPHDAREPVQFRFTHGDHVLGVLTDLGSITPHVVEAFSGCTGMLLEFNHDLDLLMQGNYPAALKRRVSGDYGHLNNQQAADFLRVADTRRLHTLVAGHLSLQNNSPAHAQAALASCADSHDARVTLACQVLGFDWLSLSGGGAETVSGLSAVG